MRLIQPRRSGADVVGAISKPAIQSCDAGSSSPGSAFKRLCRGALEAGYSPSSLVTRLDEPVQSCRGAGIPETTFGRSVDDRGNSVAYFE